MRMPRVMIGLTPSTPSASRPPRPRFVPVTSRSVNHLYAPAHVAERVELRPHLADVAVEIVLVHGPHAFLARLSGSRDDADVVRTGTECGHRALVDLPKLVGLARLHELGGLDHLLRGDQIRVASLVFGAVRRGP